MDTNVFLDEFLPSLVARDRLGRETRARWLLLCGINIDDVCALHEQLVHLVEEAAPPILYAVVRDERSRAGPRLMAVFFDEDAAYAEVERLYSALGPLSPIEFDVERVERGRLT